MPIFVRQVEAKLDNEDIRALDMVVDEGNRSNLIRLVEDLMEQAFLAGQAPTGDE